MAEGVCEYKEKQVNTSEPYRVLIAENTIKKMDPTFAGCPLYLNHVDDVDIDKIPAESVGYVVESFYNKADGKHWCKFIVTKKEGEEYLSKGWKLSNAYINSGSFGGGGNWHGVSYVKEVLEAKYEHLAIVQSPRYKESIVLTPDEFKKYNSDKELELIKLMNSETKKTKQENKNMKFNFFKKEKMENSADLESMSVVLPRCKKEVTIEKMINDMDEMQMTAGQPKMANGDDKVKVGEGEMSVNELVAKYCEMDKASKNAAPPVEDEKKKENSEDEEKKKMNEAQEEEKKKQNAADEEKKKEEAMKNSAHFEKLKNAESVLAAQNSKVELSSDRVARGVSRYGSK